MTLNESADAVRVEEKKHAELGPSSAYRWMHCPGSVALSRRYPNRASQYAEWGTAAHELADICIKAGFQDAEEHIGRAFRVGTNIYTVDMEMADCVNDFLADVQQHFHAEEGDRVLSEVSLPIGFITGDDDDEGTSDVVIISGDGSTVTIIDLKTGQGVQEFAFYAKEDDPLGGYGDYSPAIHLPNPQLVMYAAAVIQSMYAELPNLRRVGVAISQPRLKHFDILYLDLPDLKQRVRDLSTAAGVAAVDEGATLVPGEKQCKFCNAKSGCSAYAGRVIDAVAPRRSSEASSADTFAAVPGSKDLSALIVQPTDAEELARAMRCTSLIENWVKGVRDEVKARLMDGQPVPGYKLVEGRKGLRQWIDEDKALAEMTVRGRLKVSEAVSTKVLSPTEAEKVLKKSPKVWSKIAPLITQKPGSPSVALVSDPAPEYRIASTADAVEALPVGEQGDKAPAISSTLAALLQ